MRITAEQARRLMSPHKEFLDELNRIYENIKFTALYDNVGGYRMQFYYYPIDDTCPEKDVLERIRSALEMDGYKAKLTFTDDKCYKLYVDWSE